MASISVAAFAALTPGPGGWGHLGSGRFPDTPTIVRFVPYSPLQEPNVFISNAYAQAAGAAPAGGSSLMQLLPLVLMFVVLYFIMIRPQMKKQKEHKAMIDALAKGDEIVTAGGLLGRVTKVAESFVSLEVSSCVEVQCQRSAVVQVLPKGSIK